MENTAERDSQPARLPERVSAVRRREAIQHQKARHRQAPKVPPGSTKTVACVERSGKTTALRRAEP